MDLYRYFGSHVYETLRDCRLKVAFPSEFNDPFELMPRKVVEITYQKASERIAWKIKDNDFKKGLMDSISGIQTDEEYEFFCENNKEKLIQVYMNSYHKVDVDEKLVFSTADRNLRLCCFTSTDTRSQDEILMWSHYAAKHSGMRLKFSDIEDRVGYYSINEIIYSPERVPHDFSEKDDSVKAESLLLTAKTKSDVWAYENEYRLSVYPQVCVQDKNGLEFFEFESELVTAIDFGLRCPEEKIKSVTELIKSDSGYSQVKLRKAIYHKSEFALDYEDLN